MSQWSIRAIAGCLISLCFCKYLFPSHISLYRGIRRFRLIEAILFTSGAQKTLSREGTPTRLLQKNQTFGPLFWPTYQFNLYKVIKFVRTTLFCFGGSKKLQKRGGNTWMTCPNLDPINKFERHLLDTYVIFMWIIYFPDDLLKGTSFSKKCDK